MPRMLSRRAVTLLWVPSIADIEAPKLTELNAVTTKDITCHVKTGQYAVGPTDSDVIDESDLCAKAKGNAITDANYEFNAQLYRYFTPDGSTETQDLYAAFKDYPTGYLVARFGKSVSLPFEVDDHVDVYGLTIDNPRNIGDEGNLKFSIKGVPTGDMALDVEVVA